MGEVRTTLRDVDSDNELTERINAEMGFPYRTEFLFTHEQRDKLDELVAQYGPAKRIWHERKLDYIHATFRKIGSVVIHGNGITVYKNK